MRELSKEELELITGGVVTLETVVVTAPAYWGDFGYTDLWHDSFNWDAYDGYYGDTSGGGGEPPPPDCQSHDAGTVQGYSESLASQATRDIRSRSDQSTREYASVIYRDAMGAIRSSATIAGGSSGQSASIDLQALGISAGQILGIVHSHPSGIYSSSSAEATINRHPSTNDWAAADQIIAAGANPATFAHFIIGPDGVLREYNYSNKNLYNPPSTSTPKGQTISQSLQPSPC
ncbi:hypothetical protein [Lysobacter tyrosinilyticus]